MISLSIVAFDKPYKYEQHKKDKKKRSKQFRDMRKNKRGNVE